MAEPVAAKYAFCLCNITHLVCDIAGITSNPCHSEMFLYYS